ncbi:MAG: glycosyl hydrolase [Schleiferiaceae bacterium]|nr:glycosyl hydrolase [Schleiferiaceae bacterium]
MKKLLLVVCGVGIIATSAFAQKKKSKNSEESSKIASTNYGAFKLRNIGPALTSGRIADIAVNENDPNEYYVASASGGVWKTNNHGVTFRPIFDGQGSYSIGCVTIDPNNSNVVWVGSGENNNQRSVAYGDGLYKSEDAGKSWKKVGLENSEHIGMIKVDPRNSNVVYVAACGPLWSAGGDRGLYKTVDGGKTWNKILDISEHTGVNEVHLDPRNPDVIYATAHQRRRHVWTYISGGPESAIYKSTDGGNSFNKLGGGLPGGDVGRIGMSISPKNPDVVYAMIEGHGFYKSTDRGASWGMQSDHFTSGNYYVEIYASPFDVNTIYSMDTYGHVSYNGGKKFQRIPEANKHVDNHCMWINPKDKDHMIWGCDGGLYETWDNMKNWHYKDNLPVTQFYKVSTDNAEPFYNVYGGTQDNFSLGGPSRTNNNRGIVNSDWFITNTGDGFETQVDPNDDNIVYAQAQYGWLVRYDKSSGETVSIKPVEGKDEKAYRWNWDAPLVISPHNAQTLYFAANKVFKSTDRGNSWTTISPDLSRQIDRNALPVMDKVWSMDAIAKNKSTTVYGNIVALMESPLKSGLLYVGTDDGLVQISEDDGGNWRQISSFTGVPDRTYVNALTPSMHDENVVYAAFNNHKNGDFKPYVFKSTNKGKSWTNITGNLPERGSVYSIVEDHKNANLLFAGTEFGLFFSVDGGSNWMQLKSGLPTVAVRDIELQRREDDVVLASFGRGFYVLDDYSPLREMTDEVLNKQAHIFTIKDGLVYMEARPLGYGPGGFLGASYYRANNPKMGAAITYYIKDEVKTLKQQRKAKEKGQANATYPSAEEIRAEDNEEKPYLIFVIKDGSGKEIRRISKAYGTGIKRMVWDGRFSNNSYLSDNGDPITNAGNSSLAPEGQYSIQIYKSVNGTVSSLTEPTSFQLNHLKNNTLRTEDQPGLVEFQNEITAVGRDFNAVEQKYDELGDLIVKIKAGIRNTPGTDLNKLAELRKLEERMMALDLQLYGDKSMKKREFETAPSLNDRINGTVWNSWYSSSETTAMQKDNLAIVKEAIPGLRTELESIEAELMKLKEYLYESGGPKLKGDLEE